MKKHLPTFEDFLNEGTEIEIISMTDAGVSNTNRTESTKSHKDIEAYLSSPDEWTDDISFKDKQGVVYFINDLVGKNVKLGGKTILVKESHYAFLGVVDDNKQRTAVDSIIAKLNNVKPAEFCSIETIKEWCQQAKELEKQQIMKAVYDSMGTNFDPNMGRAEQYYNEIYGGNN